MCNHQRAVPKNFDDQIARQALTIENVEMSIKTSLEEYKEMEKSTEIKQKDTKLKKYIYIYNK